MTSNPTGHHLVVETTMATENGYRDHVPMKDVVTPGPRHRHHHPHLLYGFTSTCRSECPGDDWAKKLPSWVANLFHLISSADFCKPGKHGHRKGITTTTKLHNSATTCDMSDDDSSSFSLDSLCPQDEELLFLVLQGNHQEQPPIRPTPTMVHCGSSSVTPDASLPMYSPSSMQPRQLLRTPGPRPRLVSSTTTYWTASSSCQTTESRHRRLNLDDLPNPEHIWQSCPILTTTAPMMMMMIQTTTRGFSSNAQLTIPSLSNHSDSQRDDDESLDLSESDGSLSLIDNDMAYNIFANGENTLQNKIKPLRHVRNLSYCSSSSEEQDTDEEDNDDDLDDTCNDGASREQPEQQRELAALQPMDWTLDWLTGNI
jgi:hypothetical protein